MKSKNMSIKEKKTRKSSSLYHFNSRTSIFLWLFLLAMLLFYVIGSFQQFLDSTQQQILLLSFFITIVLCFFSVTGFVQSFIYIFSVRKKKYLIYTLLYIFSIILSAAVLVFLQTLNFLAAGI